MAPSPPQSDERRSPPSATSPATGETLASRTAEELLARWWHALESWERANPQLAYSAFLLTFFSLALWSRYRYIFGDYTYTFGSGDAHAILTKAVLLREGVFRASPELVPVAELFDQPPLIPLVFAGFSFVTSLPLQLAPFVIVPVLTSLALLAFFDLVRRTFDLATAIISTGLLAIMPSVSFASTEPEKAPFVLSFSVFALWLLVCSKTRPSLLPVAGLFLGLAVFSHTTGYFFIPVFVLSYFAQHGLSRRSALDRRFLLSLAAPALFVATYFVLAKLGAPSATNVAGESAGSGLLPAFVQTYVDVLTNLLRGGITERAWNLYFEAIRSQLTTPIYIASIIGLAISVIMMIRSRRLQMLPIVLWMVIVTIGFAAQFPASSHGSRYPYYVVPAFLVLAAFFLVTAFQWLTARPLPRPVVRLAIASLVIAIIGLPAVTFTTASSPGLRDLYGGHRDLANYITSEGLLDDGSHILYLGWPSITAYLLESDITYQDQIHSFGFGLRDLDEFTPDFIAANNIRYYADNHIANDGFDSSDVVMANLLPHFRMRQLGRFERRMGNYITLYELEALSPAYEEALGDQLDIGIESLTANPSLLWEPGGVLPSWIPNGLVELEPLSDGSASAVLVRNFTQFGGIRQVFDASRLGGRTVTAVTSIRGAGSSPAQSAVLSLSREGEAPFSQTFIPLKAGDNLIALEVQLPEDIELLRLTVATGIEDDGDLIIRQVVLSPESLETLLDALPGVSSTSSGG